jgi:hypothetical protein
MAILNDSGTWPRQDHPFPCEQHRSDPLLSLPAWLVDLYFSTSPADSPPSLPALGPVGPLPLQILDYVFAVLLLGLPLGISTSHRTILRSPPSSSSLGPKQPRKRISLSHNHPAVQDVQARGGMSMNVDAPDESDDFRVECREEVVSGLE